MLLFHLSNNKKKIDCVLCVKVYCCLTCSFLFVSQRIVHSNLFKTFFYLQMFSVTNNTECAKILEEIKCASCSPHAQNLFHQPEKVDTFDRQLVLPTLCKEYCKEFYYTCRGQIPGKSIL